MAVLAPGADGELPTDYVLKRIEVIASSGGYLGALGIWKDHLRFYEKILSRSKTESGLIPYKAAKGDIGNYVRTNGRIIDVNPISPIIYFLETLSVLKANSLAKHLRDTVSLSEAEAIAHTLNILTELDLEVMASRKYGVGPNSSPSWKDLLSLTRSRFSGT